MKTELTADQAIKRKMSMVDVVRYYAPKATLEFCDYFIWEETCYPISTEIAIKQIYEAYKKGRFKRAALSTEQPK
jgi:hypothetical protein